MSESIAKKTWRKRKANNNEKRVEAWLTESEYLSVKSYANTYGLSIADLIREKLKESGVFSNQVMKIGEYHE